MSNRFRPRKTLPSIMDTPEELPSAPENPVVGELVIRFYQDGTSQSEAVNITPWMALLAMQHEQSRIFEQMNREQMALMMQAIRARRQEQAQDEPTSDRDQPSPADPEPVPAGDAPADDTQAPL